MRLSIPFKTTVRNIETWYRSLLTQLVRFGPDWSVILIGPWLMSQSSEVDNWLAGSYYSSPCDLFWWEYLKSPVPHNKPNPITEIKKMEFDVIFFYYILHLIEYTLYPQGVYNCKSNPTLFLFLVNPRYGKKLEQHYTLRIHDMFLHRLHSSNIHQKYSNHMS